MDGTPPGIASTSAMTAQGEFNLANASASANSAGPSTHAREESVGVANGTPGPRRKRAKIGTKITRNRKITSCLPCRERKQKCDRTHPICQKCVDDGRKCIYVDNETAVSDATGTAASDHDKRGRGSGEDDELDESAPRRISSTSAPSLDPERASFLQKRRQIIAETWTAGRNRRIDFEARVRAARAAAVAEVLFAENHASDLKYGKLQLPTRTEAQMLLQYYQEDVQGFTNILLIDLNRARIGDFLDWWHSDPITLPAEADAPLAPLVLCIFALCLQAKRTRDAWAKAERGDKSNIPQDGHCLSILPSVSSERFLLETAGRCINALQIACPSSWASAYSAPLDIVRAETLRGIWHLGECHLQFASSTLSVATRLACAAGLHRDPKHWGALQMSEFEAQARRGAWWNIAYVEVFHSHRTGQPSSISADAADTELPLAFSAIAAQYKASGFPQNTLNQLCFDCFVARFYLTKLFLDHGASVFGLRRKPAQVVRDLEAIYDRWERSLPEHLTSRMDNLLELLVTHIDNGVIEGEPIWQLLLLQISRLQGHISVHRPYSDVASGLSASREAARRSLQKSLEAASLLITLCSRAMRRARPPPFLLLNIISYHTFNAGCLVAIHLVSGSEFAGLCSAAYRDSLTVLDNLADKRALHNVSEQAERYAAAIREIAATPGKFHVQSRIGGDGKSASHRGSNTRSPSTTQSGESGSRSTVHRASHPNASLPLRVGRTSPQPPEQPNGDTDDGQPTSVRSAPDALTALSHAEGWSPTRSRPSGEEAPLPPAPGHASSGSPNFPEGSASGGVALPPASFDHPTAGSSSDSSSVEDFFTKQRAVTSLMDRPLPGANQLNFGSWGPLGPLHADDLGNYFSGSPDAQPGPLHPIPAEQARHPGDFNVGGQGGGNGGPHFFSPPLGSELRRASDEAASGSGSGSWHYPRTTDAGHGGGGSQLPPAPAPAAGFHNAPYNNGGGGNGYSGSPVWRGDRDSAHPPPSSHYYRHGSHSDPTANGLFPPNGPSVLQPPPPAPPNRLRNGGGGEDDARSGGGGYSTSAPSSAGGPPAGGPAFGQGRLEVMPPIGGHGHGHGQHSNYLHHDVYGGGGGGGAPHHGPALSIHHQYSHHREPPHYNPPHSNAHPRPHGPPLPQQPSEHTAATSAGGLGQVDWPAWEEFITKVLQDG